MRFARSECFHFAVRVRAANFGNGEPVRITVGKCPDTRNESRDVRMRLVVHLKLEIEGPCAQVISSRRGRIILQLGIVHCKIYRVDSKTIDASV